MGIIGVAKDTTYRSIQFLLALGNLDINELVAGSTLYIPVQVPEQCFTQAILILRKVTGKLP